MKLSSTPPILKHGGGGVPNTRHNILCNPTYTEDKGQGRATNSWQDDCQPDGGGVQGVPWCTTHWAVYLQMIQDDAHIVLRSQMIRKTMHAMKTMSELHPASDHHHHDYHYHHDNCRHHHHHHHHHLPHQYN